MTPDSVVPSNVAGRSAGAPTSASVSRRLDPDSLDVAPAVVALIRDLVHDTTGLYYPDARTDQLVERLTPLALQRGFPSLLDYYYLLKYDGEASEEWGRVFDALSVPETYFWREIDQIRAVVEHVVPRCVKMLGGRPLSIWSIPCASGEEPLTIAMLLDQAGWFARVPIEIHASDASPAAIERARRGVYRDRAFRNLPPAVRGRYFEQAADGWRISAELHQRITWSVVNLMNPGQVGRYATAPIIFCRNLLIYFSERATRDAIGVMAAHMPTPGYLAVGVSESLLRITNDFELTEMAGAFVYVKR